MHITVITIIPYLVNLRAFFIKFIKTYLILLGSDSISFYSKESTLSIKSIDFVIAYGLSIEKTSYNIYLILNFTKTILNLPA